MVKVMTKTCSTCHACKPVTLFRKKRNKCKACYAAKQREYYQNNKEKVNAHQREYYQNNKEKVAARDRKYYQENKEKINAHQRNYFKENKEKITAKHREYRQENKEKIAAKNRKYYQNNNVEIAAQQREYRQENKEEIAAKQRKYGQEHKEEIAAKNRKRYANDPAYAMSRRLRNRMGKAVKAAGLDKKCASSSKLLGISYQGLKEWLEAQFTEGMTWENRSDWHVDHIVPCTAFDLLVEQNQHICFWYKNLQPLWGPDNLQKSNTYMEKEKQALISAYCKCNISKL